MENADRRGRSRLPLRFVLGAILVAASLWLYELYTLPSWDKIRSFLIGYFFASFVMEWIRQRSERMSES